MVFLKFVNFISLLDNQFERREKEGEGRRERREVDYFKILIYLRLTLLY